MKIDDRISNYMSLLLGDTIRKPTKAPENPGTASVPNTTFDNVSISPDASQRLDDAARRERLNAIQRQLSEGTYNISGKDVAGKMLNILKK